MQITSFKIKNTEYIQIYLTEEEVNDSKTTMLIDKYKANKNKVSIFINGKRNYPEILKKMILKQVELNENIC